MAAKRKSAPAPEPSAVSPADAALDAALRLAATRKWSDLTMPDIAAEAGLTLGEMLRATVQPAALCGLGAGFAFALAGRRPEIFEAPLPRGALGAVFLAPRTRGDFLARAVAFLLLFFLMLMRVAPRNRRGRARLLCARAYRSKRLGFQQPTAAGARAGLDLGGAWRSGRVGAGLAPPVPAGLPACLVPAACVAPPLPFTPLGTRRSRERCWHWRCCSCRRLPLHLVMELVLRSWPRRLSCSRLRA